MAIHPFGEQTLVFEVRGLETGALQGAKIGVIFYGSKGYVVSKGLSGNNFVRFMVAITLRVMIRPKTAKLFPDKP